MTGCVAARRLEHGTRVYAYDSVPRVCEIYLTGTVSLLSDELLQSCNVFNQDILIRAIC